MFLGALFHLPGILNLLLPMTSRILSQEYRGSDCKNEINACAMYWHCPWTLCFTHATTIFFQKSMWVMYMYKACVLSTLYSVYITRL